MTGLSSVTLDVIRPPLCHLRPEAPICALLPSLEHDDQHSAKSNTIGLIELFGGKCTPLSVERSRDEPMSRLALPQLYRKATCSLLN